MYRVTVCAAATLLVALAVVALLVAITVQPSNDDSVCGTGTDDEAISACSRVLALNPKLDEAYTARGNAYYCKGDYDEAVADFDQAIRLDPKNVVAYSIAGVLICINAWPPRVSEARCPEWVTSAVFAMSATSPVYVRLRKDRGSAANRR
jgi:tetratricopeptide (TPR) repeat protein